MIFKKNSGIIASPFPRGTVVQRYKSHLGCGRSRIHKPAVTTRNFSTLKMQNYRITIENLIKLITRSYQMLQANFQTIAHIDQKRISKSIKIYTSISLLVDWRMSNVLPALFLFK